MKNKYFDEGVADFFKGKSILGNPYKGEYQSTHKYYSWVQGWDFARKFYGIVIHGSILLLVAFSFFALYMYFRFGGEWLL